MNGQVITETILDEAGVVDWRKRLERANRGGTGAFEREWASIKVELAAARATPIRADLAERADLA